MCASRAPLGVTRARAEDLAKTPDERLPLREHRRGVRSQFPSSGPERCCRAGSAIASCIFGRYDHIAKLAGYAQGVHFRL